jgi:hypothetical protein
VENSARCAIFLGSETFGNRKKGKGKEGMSIVFGLQMQYMESRNAQKQRNRGTYGGSDNSIKSDQKKNVKHGGTWEGKETI